MIYIQTCFSKLKQTVVSSRVREIRSLQGMAAKEPYVGHDSKYSSCVGRSLDDQRRLWLTNLNFAPLSKTKTPLECQWCQSVFFCYSLACIHFMTLPIPGCLGCVRGSNILKVCLHKKC